MHGPMNIRLGNFYSLTLMGSKSPWWCFGFRLYFVNLNTTVNSYLKRGIRNLLVMVLTAVSEGTSPLYLSEFLSGRNLTLTVNVSVCVP